MVKESIKPLAYKHSNQHQTHELLCISNLTATKVTTMYKKSPYSQGPKLVLALSAVILFLALSPGASASGVFELELNYIELQHLGNENIIKSFNPNTQTSSNTQNSISTKSKNGTNKIESDSSISKRLTNSGPLKLVVCLKEAFTSQLEEPCTYGNGSIVLHLDQIQQNNSSRSTIFTEPANNSVGNTTQDLLINQTLNSTILNAIVGNSSRGNIQEDQAQHRQQNQLEQFTGSHTTNTVRILFTFRWTKSFTIILTLEQTPEALTNNSSIKIRDPTPLVVASTTVSPPARRPLSRPPELAPNNSVSSRQKGITNHGYFDRFILTENEIIPNLELNANKPWTERFSRSLRASISYKFRVYCAANYYGDQCATFCRARDDQFGHYNCSSSGQKVCLNGWFGPECERPKCREGCHQQHGHCDRPNECQCRPGWKGERCDECMVYPGCQNGYCMSPWQCTCHRNWGGLLCDQDLNMCSSLGEPCMNNGTCQNVYFGRYKCICPPGFSGQHCELAASAQPAYTTTTCMCQNGGSCAGELHLLLGRLTADNNDDELAFDGASNKCLCPAGWTGDLCQWATPVGPTTNFTTPEVALPEKLLDLVNNTSTHHNHDVAFVTATPLHNHNHNNPAEHHHHVDMRRLLSGVMLASVAGVILGSFLLIWCCLFMVERNYFSFIQMNVIRTSEGANQIRRLNERLRNSLRGSSSNSSSSASSSSSSSYASSRRFRKPSSSANSNKLNLENVLRLGPNSKPSSKSCRADRGHDIESRGANQAGQDSAPPSYEESRAQITSDIHMQFSQAGDEKQLGGQPLEPPTLVTRGALSQKLALLEAHNQNRHKLKEEQPRVEALKQQEDGYQTLAGDPRLVCPRHGHIYRQMLDQRHPSSGHEDQSHEVIV